MVTVLYRINGGEAISRSPIDRQYAYDPAYYAVATNPNEPDGPLLREVLPPVRGMLRYGPKRQLGFAKIVIPATNTMRNATQAEIDFFDDAEGVDDQKLDAAQARVQITKHPFIARVLFALVRRLVAIVNQQNAKINAVITQLEEFKADSAATATVNATQLRTRMGARPTIAPDLPSSLTPGQVRNAILNDIIDNDAPRRGA